MYFQTKKELTWWGNINMESNSSIWLIYFMNLDLRDQNFDLNGCPQKSFLTKTIRNGKNIEEESQLPKGFPSFTETGVLEIQSTSQEIWQNINSQKSKIDTFKVCFPINTSQSSSFFCFEHNFYLIAATETLAPICLIEKHTLTEFVYFFLCTVNVNNNIHYNELKSRFVLASDEVDVYFEKSTINL